LDTNKIIEYPGNLGNAIYSTITGLGNISNMIWGFFAIAITLTLFYLIFYRYSDEDHSNLKSTHWYSPDSSFFFLLVASFGILLLRLPSICAFELSVDESEWITGAATLLNDGRFWSSVNGMTSGPLNVFPLCLIKISGFTLNYANVRLFVLLFCVIPTVIFVFKSLQIIYNDKIAKIITLPLFVFFSISEHEDILAYNSEHIPMLLAASIFYFFVKTQYTQPGKGTLAKNFFYFFLCGFIIGLMPYSKLQASPIAFSLFIGIILVNILSKEKSLVKNTFLLAGVILPGLFLLSYLLLFNLTTEFWNYYVVNNFDYGSQGLYTSSATWLEIQKNNIAVSWHEKIFLLPRLIVLSKDTILFFGSLIIISVFGICFSLYKHKSIKSKNNIAILFLFSNILFGYYAVIKPGNYFLHYMILLVVPAILFTGYLLGNVLEAYPQHRNKILSYLKYYLLIAVIIPVFVFAFDGNCYIKDYLGNYRHKDLSRIAASLKKYSQPGDRMAVWGYLHSIYIEAELIQGTREPNSYLQITENSLRDYFTAKYCEDIITNKPAIFVDVVGNSSYFYYDGIQRHENFPAIKEVIDNHYELKDTVDDVRIFTRKIR
jgi:hypothetical protein